MLSSVGPQLGGCYNKELQDANGPQPLWLDLSMEAGDTLCTPATLDPAVKSKREFSRI